MSLGSLNAKTDSSQRKYVFVTGGVISGIGKGITMASLGRLLKLRGVKVAAQKLDPYVNVDPGTISPYEHGEVFVTDDGAETDLDLGHYERFIDENLNKFSNLTTGKVYQSVLDKERKGEYLGDTIQIIPHITDEIKNFIYAVGEKTDADVVLTEIGGTVGDIESQPFLEAIRQVLLEVGQENCLFIHVSFVPYLKCSHEHKSKPTQHSVKELRAIGINPGIIITRSDVPITDSIRKKISLFCNVKTDCVIENITANSLYKVPVCLEANKFSEIVCRELNLNTKECELGEWNRMIARIDSCERTVNVGIVGKYVGLHDAYLSVIEALNHAGFERSVKVNIKWIDSEFVTEENVAEELSGLGGVLLPGGFGNRGIEGMIHACRFARENNVPYFGICLGMQIASIEFARNVLKYNDANSSEFSKDSKHCVIHLMDSQHSVTKKGGTMRLGAYPCLVRENTLMYNMYKQHEISERHRHRYEFNNSFRQSFEDNGMIISGISPDGQLVEALEYSKNDFFVGVQFHPEFKSRPNRPHPIFRSFIQKITNSN